jgi:two-component system, LytTR family, sensor kinase
MIRLRRVAPFWALQLIAWPAYALVSFVGALPYVGLAPHLDSARSALFSKAAFAAAGLMSSSLMRLFYRRETNRRNPWIRIAPAAILLSYCSGLFASICSNAAREFVNRKHLGEGLPGLFGGAINASAVFLAWSACYLAIHTYQALEKEKRDTLRANALAHQAQLEMLRSQVNPHFLFNALNSVHALVRENPERAQLAVEELADFLRYSLARSKVFKVPLSEEIEILERYLALEKIRFEEKLSVTVDVQPPAREIRVPGFLLHPLLENAIKYGMQTSPMPLQIRVTAVQHGTSLCLSIANTGRWVAPDEGILHGSGTGLGLKMVQQRLEQAYPGHFEFESRQVNGWVENSIVIHLS